MAKYIVPSKIRITAKVTYEIVYGYTIAPDLGECRPDIKQIIINPNQSKRNMFLTFIHEVIHAMDHESSIGITEGKTLAIESALFDIFRFNKFL